MRFEALFSRFLSPMVAVSLLAACGGGGGGGSPTAPPAPRTETLTVTGSTRATGPTSCTGDSHDFVAADGAISVTLLETTGGVGLHAQVCAGNDDNNCSINQTRMAVGGTLTGTRRGGAGQTLKFLTLNCGAGNEPAPATPIQYRATVTYQKN